MPENVNVADPVTAGEAVPAPPASGEAPAPAPESTPGQTAAERKEELRRYQLKVDGEDVEVDEEELKRGYSLSRASYRRMEEVAQLRKQLEGFVSSFKQDPVAVMRQLAAEGEGGPGFKQAVEKFLLAEYEREKMDPKERALLEAQEKLRAAEEEKKSWAQKQREEALAAKQQHWAQEYDKAITEALAQPDVGLPKTARTVGRMAALMKQSLAMGLDVDAKDVARLVRDEYIAEQKDVLGGLQGEALLRLLGPDVAKRIREHEVAQLKRNQRTQPAVQPPAPAKEEEPKPPRRLSARDFDERVARLARGEEA